MKEFALSNGKKFATDGKGRYFASSNSTGEMMPTSHTNYTCGLNLYKQEQANKEEEMIMTKFEFSYNGTVYSCNATTNRYSKIVAGKTRRIGKAEYDQAHDEWVTAALDEADQSLEDEEVEEAVEEVAPKAEKNDLWGHVYEDANGNRVEVVSPSQDHEELDGYKYIYSAYATPKGRADYEAKKAKKAKKPTKKAKTGGMEFDQSGIHVILTDKQVDFIRHLPDTTFWESGVDSCPWIDCLCDDIGGQFANKPMTVGAMISTLREKGLLRVSFGQYGGGLEGKGRKAKFFEATEIGKEIFRQILGE